MARCTRSVVFPLCTLVPSTTNTDRHDITEILLKVELKSIPSISMPVCIAKFYKILPGFTVINFPELILYL